MFHSQNEKRKQTLYQKKNEISFLIMLFLLSLQKKPSFDKTYNKTILPHLYIYINFAHFSQNPKPTCSSYFKSFCILFYFIWYIFIEWSLIDGQAWV